MSRRDVIIVASVSCIYGIGNPEAYGRVVINLESGNIYRRNALLRQLIEGHYQRNDMELRSGTFRVRGDSLDVIPATRIESVIGLHFLAMKSSVSSSSTALQASCSASCVLSIFILPALYHRGR